MLTRPVCAQIRAARAHGVPLPRALAAPGVEDAVERAVVDEWFAGCEFPFLLPCLLRS